MVLAGQATAACSLDAFVPSGQRLFDARLGQRDPFLVAESHKLTDGAETVHARACLAARAGEFEIGPVSPFAHVDLRRIDQQRHLNRQPPRLL